MTTSLLVVDIFSTNSDVVIASDVNDNCNIDMAAACQPQFLDCYPEAVAHCALSLLVEKKIYPQLIEIVHSKQCNRLRVTM